MSWKWKGQGRESGKREARPHKEGYVKGRDKQFRAASSQRILTRTGQKLDAEFLFILVLQGTGSNSILFATTGLNNVNVLHMSVTSRVYQA